MAKTIDDYKKDWEAAQSITDPEAREAAQKAAHEGAEAIRAKQGYSGGADGSEYIPLKNTEKPKPDNFTGSANNVVVNSLDQEEIRQLMNANSQAWYGADEDTQRELHNQNVYYASLLGSGVTFDPVTGYWSGSADSAIKPQQQLPSYDSQYSSQIDALLNAILNREEFSYDYTTDPSYLAYEQKYKRLGDRAREDTLGDIAGLTGGYASSWAASAASQAQNDYNQQLSNIIPTLYDAAYNRYMDDYNKDVTNLGLVMGVDDTYYNRYRDTVSDSQWQQQFDASNEQWYKDYELSKDQFNWNKEVDDFNMKAQEQTTQFNQMMDRWSMTGVADNEVASYFGVPVGTTTESYYFNKASLALDQAKFAQSTKESNKQEEQANAEKELIVNDIIGKVNDYIDGNTSTSYGGASRLLELIGFYNENGGADLGVTDFYEIGSRLGLPTSALDEAYSALMTEIENSIGTETTYETYERAMLQHVGYESAEDWYSANFASIPYEIREQLKKNVLSDEFR